MNLFEKLLIIGTIITFLYLIVDAILTVNHINKKLNRVKELIEE